ncbi:hypothetical protein DFH27DRAFT_615673 [Peziza echinospora]|nr:hypothetical protein DFH27DRAFT_615673 [Peziza echinospora]
MIRDVIDMQHKLRLVGFLARNFLKVVGLEGREGEVGRTVLMALKAWLEDKMHEERYNALGRILLRIYHPPVKGRARRRVEVPTPPEPPPPPPPPPPIPLAPQLGKVIAIELAGLVAAVVVGVVAVGILVLVVQQQQARKEVAKPTSVKFVEIV